MMRRRGPVAVRVIALLFIAVVAAFSPMARAIDPIELPDPVLQERYVALAKELRCVQCQNQSIADSPVGLASDLRREVREMLLAGKSDQEIREYMVARYGDFILFKPAFNGRTAWLWLAPGVLLLIGVIVAVRVVRARRALVDSDTDSVDDDPSRA